VHRRLEENTVQSLREALQLSPTNATVLARLALAIQAQKPAAALSRWPRRIG